MPTARSEQVGIVGVSEKDGVGVLLLQDVKRLVVGDDGHLRCQWASLAASLARFDLLPVVRSSVGDVAIRVIFDGDLEDTFFFDNTQYLGFAIECSEDWNVRRKAAAEYGECVVAIALVVHVLDVVGGHWDLWEALTQLRETMCKTFYSFAVVAEVEGNVGGVRGFARVELSGVEDALLLGDVFLGFG